MTGRADGRWVRGGETVDPAVLERWLADQPGVAAVHLIEVPDPRFGSRPVARLRPAPGARLDPDDLRRRIAADLGPASVPARLEIDPG